MKLTGQRLVVMGGTSGIGLATAHAAIEAGAHVIVAGRHRDKLARAVDGLGDTARGESIDACDRDALDAFFARTGQIDHLVIAASGGVGGGSFATLARDELARGFDAKFWVQWQCAQAALPCLREQGSITFVTANSARMGNPGTSGLAAINGSLAAMVLPLAHELGPVRVNAVSPGVIDTPWWDRHPEALKQRIFEQITASVPVRRVGRAEEVADAIVFLAGNGYVTGVILDVDGGMRGASPG
ncbi:SDR family oxidoreductase [Lichenicoccus sp.]|uniref:SDR family oxidoreductase n=1 Tax=Lichenicoccus sp. TaxID=2781899 RepID=UPI003D0A1C55